MGIMKNIIIPIDFSVESINGLKMAILFSEKIQVNINMAEQMPDSMITSSTHGASGFQELFIGSNTFRIISATNKPVITLRKNYCPPDISKIVLPIDASVD